MEGEIFGKDRGEAVREKNKARQFRKEISPWNWGNVFRDTRGEKKLPE